MTFMSFLNFTTGSLISSPTLSLASSLGLSLWRVLIPRALGRNHHIPPQLPVSCAQFLREPSAAHAVEKYDLL